MTFSDLNIDQDMVDALAAKGIIEPFPIQSQTIPLGLAGQDIIGQAKTGTGKTFLAVLAIQKAARPAIVVTPTLPLLHQWYGELLVAFDVPVKGAAFVGPPVRKDREQPDV